jgi:spermidine synthase
MADLAAWREERVGMRGGAAGETLRCPSAIAFLTGGSVMVIEIVAARLVAPYVGVSLYTWTGIIGVVLAGLALGNVLGGTLADRAGSQRVLGAVLVLSGAASLAALGAGPLDEVVPASWTLPVRVLALAVPLFLPVAVLLGAVPPLVVELALRASRGRGTTVGRVFGAGSAGSIAGTFLTGFLLISWLGSRAILVVVAGLLVVLGCLYLSRRAVGVAVLAGGVLAAAGDGSGWAREPCDVESRYYCIRVVDMELDGRPARALLLDRLMHSLGYPDQPGHLYYDYERIFGAATDLVARDHPDLSVLQLGGGGYTFPRWVEARYPRSSVDVVEIDPAVTRIANRRLGLAASTRISTLNGDARLFLKAEPEARYDLILGDAFSDLAVPFHLTTVEFVRRVRRWLEPGGLYVANAIDASDGRFLRSMVRTIHRVFPRVYLVAKRDGPPGSARSTFVIVATDRALSPSSQDASSPRDESLGGRHLIGGAELERWLTTGPSMLLTDDHAPVDQLLAPLFAGSG